MLTDITTVSFRGVLHQREVSQFRGAFIKALGEKATPLFHNHTAAGLRFGYPLVQYKIIDGHPAVVGIGKETELLKTLREQMVLTIGREKRLFEVEEISTSPYTPLVEDAPKFYSLLHYIPLNSENVAEYDALLALTDRVCFLENLITANILSFFKGIGFHCDETLQTAITDIDKKEVLHYKGVTFRGFDLRFVSNVVLPANIGLDKSPSVGFGLLRPLSSLG